MRKTVSVELIQKKHVLGDMENNMRIISESAKNSSSDVLVFPEMFLTGYSLGRDIGNMSVNMDDDVLSPLIDVAKKEEKHIIFGLPTWSVEIEGQIHNSAMVIGPDGLKGVYDKMHLVDFGPFEEWAYFTPGNKTLLFEAGGFRFGMIICYDIFFPELTKTYALDGADGVICISASPSVTRRFFESVMRARAIESTVYFMYSNLVGFDSRMDFWGGAEIIDPRGNTLKKAPYFEESSIKAELDVEVLRRARSMRPTLRDTRMDLLGKMVNR